MTRSETIGNLAAALSVAQGAMKPAAKDSENPFFKSHYADLASVWDAIRKPFADNGLAVSQGNAAEGERVTVTTLLMHNSGEWIESSLMVIAKDDSAQAVGSAITYARRYALSSIAGVAPEDDDANAAQPPQPRPRQAPPPKPPVQHQPSEAQQAGTAVRAARCKAIWDGAHKFLNVDDAAFPGWVKSVLGEPRKSSEWSEDDLNKLEIVISEAKDNLR